MQYIQPHNVPDNYYWYQNIFSDQELSKIESDLSILSLTEAKLGDQGEENNKEIRISKVKWIPKNEQWRWLYEKLIAMAAEANNTIWHFDLHSANELIQYTEYYAEEGGHYAWHMDCSVDYMSHRKISITVQMSDTDEYEGGDLELWIGGNEPKKGPRGKGVGVLFPSYILHRVTPVTKGLRKSLVLWVGGSHFK
jgi:PKHD-type hydroxylase